jgi:alkylation response protein AidB-like acyl-CoA dehydrogenase
VTDPEKGYYGGTSVFLVEKETEGFSPGQKFEKMGLRTSPIGEIVIEDMWVPDSALVGGEGAGTTVFTQSMEWERVVIGAKHCGTMQRLMEKATDYAKEREAFGQKISTYEAVSDKIVDMKVRLEASRLLSYNAATRLDKARDVAIDACMTKVFVSEALVQTAMDTVQIFGGNGFTTDYEVERSLRDSIGGKIYSGTNEIQRNILAKWLGL